MRYMFTVNVAMFHIHGNPIVPTTRDSPAMICSRQHLPRTEGPARGGPEGLLQSVGSLHPGNSQCWTLAGRMTELSYRQSIHSDVKCGSKGLSRFGSKGWKPVTLEKEL